MQQMDRLVKALGEDMASFDALQKADPQQLAKFLHNEHPQTIALVLSHLNPSQAAALLASLPPHLRGDVALLALSIAEASGDAGPEAADRAALIRALDRAGLKADAQGFALEGLITLEAR